MHKWTRIFVFAWLSALAGCSFVGSNSSSIESESEDGDCAFTQGYWKNHPEAWPVDSLSLGSVSYTQDELLAILGEPVRGNGLISVSHQLIAAKLNIAAGADDSSMIDVIARADAMIGALVVPPIGSDSLDTAVTSELNDALDAFNNLDAGSCQVDVPPPPPPEPMCGDGHLDEGEDCDDGNTLDGDGCSADCRVEPPPPPPPPEPVCGDGHLDDGEACDDGNTTDGDGCSAECCVEEEPPPPPPPPPPPVCGDGNVDEGEQCDDGNTADGDGCSAICCLEHA